MRSYLPDYELRPAGSLRDALDLLASEPGVWRPFAGGTDLMVLLDAGALTHRKYVDLGGVRELAAIEVSDRAVSIGALATYTDLRAHPLLSAEFPLLGAAARETGGVAIQNRGTIGGNIANASPAADTPPVLLVYDAALELVSSRGTRRVEYAGFHTGYKMMDLAPDELIARVHLPRGRARWVQGFRKVGTRRAQAISKVCVAGAMHVEDGTIRDVRLALGSVAPTVVRCVAAERAVRGLRVGPEAARAARDAVRHDVAPIDDVRSSARYRLRVSENLVAAFVSGEAHA